MMAISCVSRELTPLFFSSETCVGVWVPPVLYTPRRVGGDVGRVWLRCWLAVQQSSLCCVVACINQFSNVHPTEGCQSVL